MYMEYKTMPQMFKAGGGNLDRAVLFMGVSAGMKQFGSSHATHPNMQ